HDNGRKSPHGSPETPHRRRTSGSDRRRPKHGDAASSRRRRPLGDRTQQGRSHRVARHSGRDTGALSRRPRPPGLQLPHEHTVRTAETDEKSLHSSYSGPSSPHGLFWSSSRPSPMGSSTRWRSSRSATRLSS